VISSEYGCFQPLAAYLFNFFLVFIPFYSSVFQNFEVFPSIFTGFFFTIGLEGRKKALYLQPLWEEE